MAVTLGKDVTIGGVSNARTVTVNNSASEIDVTKLGDTSRKFRKSVIEQTVEIECVDDPGVDTGDTFTLTGTDTGNVVYVVTSVGQSEPIDGIITYTVSAARNSTQS
jgi:hypothetical protein